MTTGDRVKALEEAVNWAERERLRLVEAIKSAIDAMTPDPAFAVALLKDALKGPSNARSHLAPLPNDGKCFFGPICPGCINCQ